MKYNPIKFRLVFIFLAGLFLFGCSDTEGQRLVEEYENVDAHNYSALKSKGDALLKHLIEREKLDEMESECKGFGVRVACTLSEANVEWLELVKKTLLLGIEKQDVPLVGQIARNFELNELKLNDTQRESFSELILSNLDALSPDNEALASAYDYIGITEIKKRDYYKAYEHFAAAVIVSELNKDYYSGRVKSMLKHFGCAQDLLAWNELSSGENIMLEGMPYPELSVDVGFDVGIARKAMVNLTKVPELQKKCPINLYKE